jgi:hypothetical protein
LWPSFHRDKKVGVFAFSCAGWNRRAAGVGSNSQVRNGFTATIYDRISEMVTTWKTRCTRPC